MKPAWSARAVPASAAVYVLDGFFQNSGEAYAKIDCRPVIGDLNELAEWDVFCRRSGWNGGAAIHIDTGMNRLGLTVAEAQGIIPRINAGDHGITLVMSHLVSAEQLNNPLNAKQLARLSRDRQPVLGRAGVAGQLVRRFISARNSSSTWCGRALRSTASTRRRKPTIRCSRWSKLKARIVQIRNIERGETVGYGGTWTARRPTRLGDRLGRLCRRLFPRGKRQ